MNDINNCIRKSDYQTTKDLSEYIEYARKKLIDYYGTAMHMGMIVAGAELTRIQNLSDDEVLMEAKKIKLI